ncbi:MAG: PAS domain-containing protein [Sphingomonas bacterium]
MTSPLGFLDNGGEMGERIAALDWSEHPLGPAEQWSVSLKIAVNLCLHSTFPSAVYWGADFHVIYNDAWAVTFPERHPAALGRPGAEARHDSWEIIGLQLAAVLRSGKGLSATDEHLPMLRDGEVVDTWWTYSLSPICDETGSALGVLSQGNDTTIRAQAERSLRASEERLQMALDASGDVGTWEWDLINDVVVGDDRMARLYGVDPRFADEGAPASAYLQHIHPDDYESLSAIVLAGLANGRPISHEYRLVFPDGTERWLSMRGRCRNGEDGRPKRFSGVSLDISVAKRNEAELRHAKEEREFILNLVEKLRAQQDPDDVMQIAAEAVGRRLGVNRAGFFKVIDDRILEYGACWVDGVLPPLTGSVPTLSFGEGLGDVIRAGRTLVFGTPDDTVRPLDSALDAIDTKAGVSVPFLRGGHWEAGFYLSHGEPRAWTPEEVSLVEEIAQLSWDAAARVRAAASLKAVNESLVGEVARSVAERDRIWDVSHDLLGVLDLNGVWTSVNPAWKKMLGWSQDEIIGRTSEWLHHPDDLEPTRREIIRVIAGKHSSGFQNRYRTSGGDYRTLSWQATRAEDRIYVTARDVTEERQQQAALLAAEERTRLVLEAMDGVGVWTYDIALDRFFSDVGFAGVYGFEAERVGEGATLAEVIALTHPDDLARLQQAIAQVRERQGDDQIEYRIVRPDGSIRWIMSRIHVLLDAAGKREKVIGVGIDVTRQRELEDRLRQAQKMEAVGQLTGGLAHDFNNLLTAISGAMEMMQMRLKQGRIADLPRYIATAQTASGRAAALTHRLLAFSRRQPLDPKPVDVNRLVADIEELVRGTVGPGVVVEVMREAALWPTLVDPNQLENALLNLCINARDAMAGGGHLTIRTANISLDARGAHERDLTPGEYLSLSVSDTGTGMTPEVIARAFDPFFTTKPMGQGTGLGLSMIYGFARQSGGQVRIESVEGEGTTMLLYLPRHDGPVEDGGQAGRRGEVPRSDKGEAVLVVDDEPAVRMLVTEILDDLGYVAMEAGDGPEALAVLHSNARIDLLITDVGLPGGMNGRQVADAARAARPELPVLFITGFAENSVVGDGPLEPGMELVTKPFSMEALGGRIREMIGRPA